MPGDIRRLLAACALNSKLGPDRLLLVDPVVGGLSGLAVDEELDCVPRCSGIENWGF